MSHRWNKKLYIASLLFFTGIGIPFFCCIYTPTTQYTADFSRGVSSFGPVENVSGAPFPFTDRGISLTEEMAHIRIPYHYTHIGKKLTVQLTIDAEATSTVDIGIRKGTFWLDYEHRPLFRKGLNNLYGKWQTRTDGSETIFLHPKLPRLWDSVAAFHSAPPHDGIIGIIGDNISFSDPSISTAPFRDTDDPNAFVAIDALYAPNNPNSNIVTKTMTFDLTHAFQNPDGSFDLMIFSKNGTKKPTVFLQSLSASIKNALPSVHDMMQLLRTHLRTLLFRPLPWQ